MGYSMRKIEDLVNAGVIKKRVYAAEASEEIRKDNVKRILKSRLRLHYNRVIEQNGEPKFVTLQEYEDACVAWLHYENASIQIRYEGFEEDSVLIVSIYRDVYYASSLYTI